MLFFHKPPFDAARDGFFSLFGNASEIPEEADGSLSEGLERATEPPERPAAPASSEARASIEDALSLDGPPDVHVSVAGRTYQYHGGSGYFGLQCHPEVLAATCEATLRYGVGTATSRTALTSPPVFEVERRIAAIFETSRAFYTSSGYMANQLLVDALAGTFEKVFIDEAAHHSLFDAVHNIRDGRYCPIVFRHRDTADLEEKLETTLQWNERPLVLTDGLFSLLGTIAPLDRYIDLLSRYEGASLLVDDAHGIGVLGRGGRGTLEHFGIDTARANLTQVDPNEQFAFSLDGAGDDACPVSVYVSLTMSKAVGGYGGVIPGSDAFVERLMERSRIFAGASAPPSPIAAATSKGLAVLFDDARLREQMRDKSRYLKSRLREEGFEPGEGTVPIATLTLGSALNMRRIQKELSRKGILLSYIPRRPGLGSEGALRIAVFATHTDEMIDTLADTLREVA